jgi:hypothetical protein
MSQEITSPRFKSAVPVLTAMDVSATVNFWVDKLGFSGGIVSEGFAVIHRDEVEIFMTQVNDQLIPDNTQAWFRVSNLEALYEEWSKKISTNFGDTSGPAITPIKEEPWGREFAVRDTAGNCLHFSEAPTS